MQYEVGDLVRYYSETTQEEYIGIISEPDIITWFDGLSHGEHNLNHPNISLISA